MEPQHPLQEEPESICDSSDEAANQWKEALAPLTTDQIVYLRIQAGLLKPGKRTRKIALDLADSKALSPLMEILSPCDLA